MTLLIAVIGFFSSCFAWCNRTRTYDASVASVAWEQSILVDRYRVWEREAWKSDLPQDAFEVSSLGDKIHHYDKVFDGYETEYYTVQSPCGQDCTPIPRSCSEQCSSNNNGFATCREVCSGGGQSCSTRYCPEQKSRQVATYRDEPRYAEYVRFKIWDWGHQRTIPARGTSVTDLRWPEEEARVGQDLAEGEKERESRSGTYKVTLSYDEDESVTVDVTEGMFGAFPVGSSHQLVIKMNDYTVDGSPVQVSRD